MNRFLITQHNLKRINGRGIATSCPWCGKSFQIGEQVITLPRATGTKRYHQQCWDNDCRIK